MGKPVTSQIIEPCPDDPRIDAIARGIHAFDCYDANEDRKRRRLPPVEKWADPWQPSGVHQLRKLRRQAKFIVAELDALQRTPTPAAEGE